MMSQFDCCWLRLLITSICITYGSVNVSSGQANNEIDVLERPRRQVDRRLFYGFNDVQTDSSSIGDTLLDIELHTPGAISWQALYTGEVFNNSRGGLSTKNATAYVGNLDLTMTIDLDQLVGADMGHFVIYGQQHTGPGISGRFTGDSQTLSNLDADNFTQLSAYFWERSFVDELIATRIGLQDANSTFCALDTAAAFLHSSFGVIPTVPMPTFPLPALGAVVTMQMTDSASLITGVFDDSLAGTTGTFQLAASGQIWMTELQKTWTLLGNDLFKGELIAGYWYQDTARLDLASGATHANNQGVYLGCEQLLINRKSGQDKGLAVFGQFGWAPADRNDLEFYYGAGLVFHGLVPSRSDDSIGIGLASAQFTDELVAVAGLTHETAIEMFYIAQLTPWMQVQPDMQYIANPGGNGRDALATGLRFHVNF